MRRYEGAIIVLVCITIIYSFTNSLFFLNAQAGWTEDRRLTYFFGYSYDPRAACNGDTIHLVWWEHYGVSGNLREEVFYKRSTDAGETWGEDVLLSVEDAQTSALPQVSVAGHVVHVVWFEDDYGLLYRRSTDGGETWGTIDSIVPGGVHSSICVVGDTIYVCGVTGATGDLLFIRSVNGGNNWQSLQTIAAAHDSPTMRNISNNVLNIVISYEYTPEIYNVRSFDGGETWLDSQLVSEGIASGSQMPAMDTDDSTGMHITWYDYEYSPYPWTGDIFYRSSRDSGTTWEEIDSLTVMHRAVASDILAENNNLHLVWEDDRHDFNDNFEIYYRMSQALGQQWGVEQRLTDAVNWSRRPALACDGRYLHLFWFDLRDDPSNIVGEIYYKRKDLSSGIATERKSSIVLGTSTDVLPNPFTTVVRLQITDDRYEGVASIRLYDVSGKEVMVYKVADRAKQIILDTRDLPCGVYFLALEAASCSGLMKVIKVE